MRLNRQFIFLLKRRILFLLGLILCLSGDFAAAKFVEKPVGNYQLDCGDLFSCPESLRPRVSFWIEVFSRWDTSTAIFHDKDNPHRVYSTIKRKEGCRGKSSRMIARERKRLQSLLINTSKRVKSGRKLTSSQAFINDLFVGKPASEMQKAAHRIRCQSGNKDRMAEALAQFDRYRPTILDALESENLTPELQYLPFVESAFNPRALSHVGAAGLWQIMPATGRKLGLRITNSVDDRYDPKRATYAAAKYFRNSVDELSEVSFENGHTVVAKDLNPFVITSYNYGVRGMARAIEQVGLNYERLLKEYKSPSFQTAVRNFYASFLAARHVAKNSERFFGSIDADLEGVIHSYDTVTLTRATSIKRIVDQLNVDQDTLKKLNPAIKTAAWQNKLLLPRNYQINLPYRENGWEQGLASILQLPKEYERAGYRWHRVSRGQTACGIAKRYRTSCRQIRKLNRLNRKGAIYVGQRLKIPTSGGGGIGVQAGSGKSVAASSADTSSSAPANSSQSKQSSYRVRSGDTACKIARRFSMKCDEFLAINGLTRKSIIRTGLRVTVSAKGAWHIVKSGQTVCGIAKAYQIRCKTLLSANRLRLSSTIRAGQRLRIPNG